jgi:hypothetical protein
MATTQRFDTAYGLSQPLLNEFPAPIISNRAPTTADKAQLGSVWVNKVTNDAWVLTSITNNHANWLGMNSGTGTFTSITVTPGNLTVTNGNITATLGDITSGAGNIDATTGNVNAGGSMTAGTTITAGTGMTITTGDLTISSGNAIVTGSVAASSVTSGLMLSATGDSGTGFATITSFTNATDTAQSTGALSILSDSANPGTNAGFIKIYVGLTPAFIPYFTNIAP